MQAAFTDTQDALRAAVADLLADHADRDTVRAVALDGDGFDPALWHRLVAMGVTDLPGAVEEGVVAEELGRVVAPVPYLDHLAALDALAAAAADDPLVDALRDGGAIGVVADTVPLRRTSGGGVRGALPRVTHGAAATHLLAVAEDDGTRVRVVIEADATTRTPLPTMDRTQPLVDVTVDDAPARIVGPAPAGAIPSAASTRAAHDLVGVAAACLAMGVGYAGTRTQFGRPIGTFQAVSHRLVDMFVALESARSHAYHAAWAVAEDAAVAAMGASQAKAAASDAAVACAEGAIQVHGGVGFTWEHDLHLYLKRARSVAARWGTARAHRRRIADQLGLGDDAPATQRPDWVRIQP